MKDMNNKFLQFYQERVVLRKEQKNFLFQRKNLNINRLKEGLEEYNIENGTDYKMAEASIVQGSVAMATVIQNESNEYDIDVAIIFEKDQIPEGTRATKNIVVNALKRKCTNFKKEPTAKTNCIRIEYQGGYHIDFAIYRRYKESESDDEYIYEHCGSEWRKRSPRKITNWFLVENEQKGYQLREVVRLLKMFSKSRPFWKNMPGGLVQSVLANEVFQQYTRMDECFYYTVKAIRDRLAGGNMDVLNPTDTTMSLHLVKKDDAKMTNLLNNLDRNLEKLEVLFEDGCSDKQACEAWEGFFNHPFWTEQKEGISKSAEAFSAIPADLKRYRETEEFIGNRFPIKYSSLYELSLDCKVVRNGKTVGWLQRMMSRREVLYPQSELYFSASTNVPEPFQVYWKVKNKGEVARQNDMIRGQIIQTDKLSHKETTSFRGNHYVECYIVKDGECVAKERINVEIKFS